jgi:phosphate transport system substrate-binding protein
MLKKQPAFIISSLIIVLCLSACFKKYKAKIQIDGSSTVYPITEAVAEEYREIEPDVRVTVGVSGTGGGFKKFLRGETDISNASRPITKSELEDSRKNNIEFIEIPVAYDGLAVVVSKQNDFVDYLTVAELKKIWEPQAQGVITLWSHIREGWPEIPIHLYGAGTSSGTYDYFTKAIVGTEKASRGDYTASEDDNVLVQGVSSDKGGLGYFGLAYYQENAEKLKLVPIDDEVDSNGKGPILPNMENILNATYQPLARPEFIYVNAESAKDPFVMKFINYYMDNCASLVKEVGYIPMQAEAYQLSKRRVELQKKGTMFEFRSTVGVNMINILSEDLSPNE